MTRDEYLSRLARALRRLSETDRADALEYYREYFDEAGSEHEQKVIEELGTPYRLATQIKAELALRRAEENPKSTKKVLRAVLMGIGAVFAAPIAIPLAVLALALVFIWALLLLSFFVIGAGLALAGLSAVVLAVATAFQSPATGLALFGDGLALLGLGGLIFLPTLRLSRWSFRRFAAFLRRKLSRNSPRKP